jgi:hypothetical protein
MALYRLHGTTDEDVSLFDHPAANVEPGSVVHLSDGREALVTRVDTNDDQLWALLDALVVPSSLRTRTA